jgi:hypothetical protein
MLTRDRSPVTILGVIAPCSGDTCDFEALASPVLCNLQIGLKGNRSFEADFFRG